MCRGCAGGAGNLRGMCGGCAGDVRENVWGMREGGFMGVQGEYVGRDARAMCRGCARKDVPVTSPIDPAQP